jgi:hypothetical protein
MIEREKKELKKNTRANLRKNEDSFPLRITFATLYPTKPKVHKDMSQDEMESSLKGVSVCSEWAGDG